jgi:DmsE family decaheme c-type cytochrome
MKRFLICVALIALLPGLSRTRSAYAASGEKKTAAVVSKSDPADFVGSDVCATCHAEVAKKFESNPHSKLALTHGAGATCESCHGSGKAHVEGGGDVTKIKRLSKLSAKAVDETCLGCHAGTHPNFERSPHGKAGVGCTGCHSVHNGQSEGGTLLKVSQSKLCFTCHTDVKPAFSQPFHHRVEEGLIKCSDCHDVHGGFEVKNLRSTADRNAICTKCHTENAGPFAYEHPVVKTEGCVACHTPHGSPNARLLNVSNINTLCLQCHSATNSSAFPHAVSPSGPAHNQATQYVSCTSCHTQIHGSNASNVFFK